MAPQSFEVSGAAPACGGGLAWYQRTARRRPRNGDGDLKQDTLMDLEKARRMMVDAQVRTDDVTDKRIQSALLFVPREAFVSKADRSLAYADLALPAGEGRWAHRPRDLAKMLQALQPEAGEAALVIAAGGGYSAALLARLCETVIGLEADEDAADATGSRLEEIGVDNAVMVSGPLQGGWAKDAPFPLIFVDGSVEVVPQAWLDQLAEGGRMGVVVRDGGVGEARIYTKAQGRTAYRRAFESGFRPLPGFEAPAGFAF